MTVEQIAKAVNQPTEQVQAALDSMIETAPEVIGHSINMEQAKELYCQICEVK